MFLKLKDRVDSVKEIIIAKMEHIEEVCSRMDLPRPMSWAAWSQLRATAWHEDLTVNNLDSMFRDELKEVLGLTPEDGGNIHLVSGNFPKCADIGNGPEFAQFEEVNSQADQRSNRRGFKNTTAPEEDEKLGEENPSDAAEEDVDEAGLGEEDVPDVIEDEEDGEAPAAPVAKKANYRYNAKELNWVHAWFLREFVSMDGPYTQKNLPKKWDTRIRIDFTNHFGLAVDDIKPYSLRNIFAGMVVQNQFDEGGPDYTDPDNYPSKNARRNRRETE